MWWILLVLFGCRERLEPEGVGVQRGAPMAWHAVLQDVVDDRGDVDYDALRERRHALDAYVAWIAQPGGRRTPDQVHAFWINSFNALVLFQILERDLEGSVLDAGGVFPFRGSRFFLGTEFVVAGEPMSLWELGHERLTHSNQDYRDFLVLSVGARSGPGLKQGLIDPTELERDLRLQTQAFFGSDRALRFTDDGQVHFNPIFDRYWPEIALYRHGVNRCELAAWNTTGERQARLLALAERGCPHDFFPFDWSLNASEEAP